MRRPCFTALLLPEYADKVFTMSQPFTLGEVVTMLWLVIMGAKEQRSAAAKAQRHLNRSAIIRHPFGVLYLSCLNIVGTPGGFHHGRHDLGRRAGAQQGRPATRQLHHAA